MLTINFDATFQADLLENAKAIFLAFQEYIFFIVAILIAFQILHIILAMLIKPPRRMKKLW